MVLVTGVAGTEHIGTGIVAAEGENGDAVVQRGGTQRVPAGAVAAFEGHVAGGGLGIQRGDQIDVVAIGGGAAGTQRGPGGQQHLGDVLDAGAGGVTAAGHGSTVGETGGGVAGDVHGQSHRWVGAVHRQHVIPATAHGGEIAAPAGTAEGRGGQAVRQGIAERHGGAQGVAGAVVAHGEHIAGAGLSLMEIAAVGLGECQVRWRQHRELETFLALMAFLAAVVVLIAGGGQRHRGGAVLTVGGRQRQSAGVAAAADFQIGGGQQVTVGGAGGQINGRCAIGVADQEVHLHGGRAAEQPEHFFVADQAERGMGLIGTDIRQRLGRGRRRRESAVPAALIGGQVGAGQRAVGGVQGRAAVAQRYGARKAVVIGERIQARLGDTHLVALDPIRQTTAAPRADQVVGTGTIQIPAHVTRVAVTQTVLRYQGIEEGHGRVVVRHVETTTQTVTVGVAVGGVAGGRHMYQPYVGSNRPGGKIQAATIGTGPVAVEGAVAETGRAIKVSDHQAAAGPAGSLVLGQGAAADVHQGADQIQAGAAGAGRLVAVDIDLVKGHRVDKADRQRAAVTGRHTVVHHPVVTESGAFHMHRRTVKSGHGAAGTGGVVDYVIGEPRVVERQSAVTVAGGVLAAVPIQRAAIAVAGVVAVTQPQGGKAGIEAVVVIGVDAE